MSGVNFEIRSQFLPENVIHFWMVPYLNPTDHCVFISKIMYVTDTLHAEQKVNQQLNGKTS